MINTNYSRIIKLASPIILANASVPLLGLADTAIIGQTGTASDLGAIALASLVFSFVYWGFGFLRMGTTGFIAQAAGAKEADEMHALVFRAVLLGLAIGIALILLQTWIGRTALFLMSASDVVKASVEDYFYIRIWGAPATLITFSLLGTFIGMGWTRYLLWTQLFLNGLNILLNVTFVLGFGLAVKGIALGTVLAEWTTLFVAGFLLMKKMELNHPVLRVRQLRSRIFDQRKLIALIKVNTDIMIRTLALISGFAWFANQGAKFGDHILAANHVLLQFVSLSAFFLDGYAHVAEMLAGQAYGAKKRVIFVREVRHSSILAGITALGLSIAVYALGSILIPLLTKDVQVQTVASQHSSYASLYILVSFAAFQLDGIFIGVTKSREMRNATLIALAVFIGSENILTNSYQNAGLWMAFIVYVVIRAVALSAYYPSILREMDIKKSV